MNAADQSQHVPCDLCGSDDCEVYLEPRRMRSLAESDFTVLGEQGEHPRIVRCRVCGLIYANPRDAAEGLVGKYKALPIASYLQEESSRRLTASRDAAMLRRHVPPPARVLDVGCSAGLFLDCLGGDYERYGVEPGQESAAVARRLIGEAFIHNGTLDTADFPAGSFDAITMWDVVEHLVSPRQALLKTASLLKSGGRLIVMTPDIGSLFARILGHRWPHLIRSHIYYFTRPTLERMLGECGFAVESWGTYSRRFTLRYLFQRAGLLKASPQTSSPGRKIGFTVPVNFFDACLAIARKR
ncbi:MAG: class I SAM-dependent methyltransferase [Planctomycetaceae bacterium]|nr:class I SAM-dependent methyltransferase [Planctomycetaceae bacterium]